MGSLGRVGGSRKAVAGIGRRRGRGEEGLLEGRLHGHGCSRPRPGRALAEATAASSVSAGPAGGQGTRGCRRAHEAPLGATRRAPRGLSVRYLQELEEGDTIARALCTSEPCARLDRIVAGCHATTHRAARQVAPCLFYVKENRPREDSAWSISRQTLEGVAQRPKQIHVSNQHICIGCKLRSKN